MRALLLAVLLSGCAASQRHSTAPSYEPPPGRLVATAGNWGFPQASRVTLLGGLGGPGLTTPSGGPVSASTGSFSGAVSASSYTASAASGANAFIANAGAKYCLNPSCTRYMLETSSEIYFRGSRIAVLDGGAYFNGGVDIQAGLSVNGSQITNAGSTGPLSIYLNDAQGTCVGNGDSVSTADCDGSLSAGTLKIGTTGVTLNGAFGGSASIDFASIAAGTCATSTITVTGASASGPWVVPSIPNGANTTGSVFYMWVSAANTVTVKHCCVANVTCDPASATFAAVVINP